MKYYGTPASSNSQLKQAIFENNYQAIQSYLELRKSKLTNYQETQKISQSPFFQFLKSYHAQNPSTQIDLYEKEVIYGDIANPYKDYGQGNTALHLALQLKKYDTATALLEYAVDNQERRINITNHQGETPLHIAAKLGNTDIIIHLLQILLMNGISLHEEAYISLDHKDDAGKTFMDWLTTEQRQLILILYRKQIPRKLYLPIHKCGRQLKKMILVL